MTLSDQELARELAAAHESYSALALDEAVAGYQAVLDQAPDNYDALLGLARTYTRLRDHEPARAAAERCIELEPERAEGYAALGVLDFLLDKTTDAREALERALALAPDDPETLVTLAQVAADEHQSEQAMDYLATARVAIEELPEAEREAERALAWHAETYVHLTAGDNTAAREAAQEVIARRDANLYAACLAYSNLGVLEAQTKNYDQAIAYLEQAFEMNPRFYRVGSSLGRVLILRKQFDRAAEVMATVVEHPFSDQGMDRYIWAMALAKSGHRPEAIEQYRAALSAGLKGLFAWQARWQIIWQSQWGRYAVIGLGLLAALLYIVLVKPDGSVLTLVLVAVVILVLQRFLGRSR